MADVVQHLKLTHAGALKILDAAVAKATAMGVPMCISIVDDGGNLLAFVRMDGARTLSFESSRRKAMTAASSRVQTGALDGELANGLAHATGGLLVNLKGGAPIVVDNLVVGGIGVGSGTGEQDLEVALAGLAAIGAKGAL